MKETEMKELVENIILLGKWEYNLPAKIEAT